MSLDQKRQAILDIFCHVCETLISHLDVFDEYDCYDVVSKCFDPALKQFGAEPPETDKISPLLEDLLVKIDGSFKLKFSSNKKIIKAFHKYRDNVLGSHVASPAKIGEFCKSGEELSFKCYSLFCNPLHRDLTKASELSIRKSHETRISCVPDNKYGGTGEICFYFGTDDFDFMRYVNLPFYFFHEYLSHIHSARLFNESESGQTSSFEDGWLLFIEHQKYKEHILTKPQYLMHYLEKYLFTVTYSDNCNRYTQKGYEMARHFAEIAGKELCLRISFLLASTDYDFFHDYPSVHTRFILAVNRWIKSWPKMHDDDRKEAVAMLTLALDGDEPLKNLLDIMK